MEFSKVFTIKKELTEQQFLRNVLIALSKDEKAPSNIMTAKFGNVTEFQTELLVLSADVEVNYSGSCGYDREEQYLTTESKYVSEGEWYISGGVERRASSNGRVTVDVVKTRTVTDWRPHSGILKTDADSSVFNQDEKDFDFLRLSHNSIAKAKEESFVEAGTALVNSSAYNLALKDCEGSARVSVKWPGDHHKDENYSCKTDVKEIKCYIVPCYSVEYEYNGKVYRARGYAFGNVNEIHETPESDGKIESIETIKERRTQRYAEAEKPEKIKKIFIAVSVIMGLVGVYALLNRDKPGSGAAVCLPLGFITMAIAIAVAIVISVKVNKAIHVISVQADEEMKALNNIKVDSLIVALQNFNLPELSTEEKNNISDSDDYK